LLDEEGMEAITMREVARRAGTTTPTLYERFGDREALLWAMVTMVQGDVYRCVADAHSVEKMAEIVGEYLSDFTGRLDLVNQYWPRLMSTDRPKPVLELAKRKLIEERKCSAKIAEETAFSLTALVVGTAMLLRTAGPNTLVAKELGESTRKAIRAICYGACDEQISSEALSSGCTLSG
jgi:AcrR family transcriptional regulator